MKLRKGTGGRFVCEICSQSVEQITKTQKRCSQCKRLRLRKCARCGNIHSGQIGDCVSCFGKGRYYVYGWYFTNEQLPFYVGKGKNKRAWRSSCPQNTEVRIYRYGMAEQDALLVESILISIFKQLGKCERNKNFGNSRSGLDPMRKTR